MQYIDRLKATDPIDYNNALILGRALHTGIQKGVDEAVREYYFSYPIIDDNHINEAMKLEYLIPLARAMLPDGEYEVPIIDSDFIGFIDLLVPTSDNHFDIYDFKYTNKPKRYNNSNQLHLYKYFFEKCNPGATVDNLYFVFVPKIGIRQKKTETLLEFRRRIEFELQYAVPRIVKVDFDYCKVIDFLLQIKRIDETTDFPKNEGRLCEFCEYQEYCQKGFDYIMKLPSTERRTINKVKRRKLWIYGAPFCGKTTFANNFPTPLMLNTDGNYEFVDAPVIPIKDVVEVEGRITKKTLAWDIFKEAVDELEKGGNDFKTIIVDLVEGAYEYCRQWVFDKLNIQHESEDSFRAWNMVRTEFLNTLHRLMSLDYENIILISHEDTSKDIAKKGGDKITAIKPNIQEKVALRLAGMVDIVARVVADGDDRTFNFKSDEVVFGGGRLKVDVRDIPLDVDELFKVYDKANGSAVKTGRNAAVSSEKAEGNKKPVEKEKPAESRKKDLSIEDIIDEDDDEAALPAPEETEDEKPVRTRRSRRTTRKD